MKLVSFPTTKKKRKKRKWSFNPWRRADGWLTTFVVQIVSIGSGKFWRDGWFQAWSPLILFLSRVIELTIELEDREKQKRICLFILYSSGGTSETMDNIWQRRKGSFCGWVTPPLHIFLLTALGLLLAGDNNRLQVDGESLSIHLCIIRPVIPTNAFGKPHAYYQGSVDTEMMNNFLWRNKKMRMKTKKKKESIWNGASGYICTQGGEEKRGSKGKPVLLSSW